MGIVGSIYEEANGSGESVIAATYQLQGAEHACMHACMHGGHQQQYVHVLRIDVQSTKAHRAVLDHLQQLGPVALAGRLARRHGLALQQEQAMPHWCGKRAIMVPCMLASSGGTQRVCLMAISLHRVDLQGNSRLMPTMKQQQGCPDLLHECADVEVVAVARIHADIADASTLQPYARCNELILSSGCHAALGMPPARQCRLGYLG